jgi:two-component system, NtrC family, sensor kinase
MKINKICIYILLLLPFKITAQNFIIDSLTKEVSQQKESSEKVNTLNELSWNFLVKADRKNSLRCANEALALAQKIGDKKGEGDSYLKIARMHAAGTDSAEFEEAFIQTQKAEKIFESIKDMDGAAKCLMSYGNISRRKENPLDALKKYSAALDICLVTGNKQSTAFCYSSIGVVQYYHLINHPEALRNFFAALRLWEELGARREIASMQQYIGRIYYTQGNNTAALKYFTVAEQGFQAINDSINTAEASSSIADIYFSNGNYTEALEKHAAAIRVFERTNNLGNAAFSSSGIGKIYEQQGIQAKTAGYSKLAEDKLNEALKYYLKAVELATVSGDPGGVCYYYSYAASACVKLGRLADAEKYAAKSLELAKQLGDKVNFEKSYSALVELDSTKGDYRQAFNNLRFYMLYRDSMVNQESVLNSMKYKLQYESEKNEAAAKAEQDKKDAAQRRIRNIQYAASAVFLLLAGFLFWNNRLKHRAKRKIERAYDKLKSAQAQLVQAEKMASLGELTAGIAHEIQNPLNFVKNFSEVSNELMDEMLEEAEKGNYEDVKAIAADIKQNLEKIIHHGGRADGIVKGMLQHSRTSTGKKEPTNINALADEYLRLAYHGLRAKDKTFNALMKTDYDESLGNIHVVSQDIGRVILNLITNAFHAVTERNAKNAALTGGEKYEPTVSVATKKMGNQVEIKIADNGTGIPQKALDKIFQPFFTTKPTGQGTGLGLSLSYDIIKSHGGEIKVETEEGKGSKFIITLPV